MTENEEHPAPFQGSVRSLPPNRMNNIKHMFDTNQTGAPGTNRPQSSHTEGDSYVKKAQSKFLSDPLEDGKVQKPTHPGRPDKSPIRRPRTTVSPSRQQDTPGHPVPQPRRFTPSKLLNFDDIRAEKRLSSVSVDRTADTAEKDKANPPSVSKLVEQFKANEEQVIGQLKKIPVPLPGGSAEHKYSDSSLERRRRHASPVKRDKIESAKHQDEFCTSNDDDKHSKETCDEVTYTVSERSKLFQTAAVSPASKPSRPPPPARQRSITEGSAGDQTPKAGVKGQPPRPVRRTSLIDKSRECKREGTDAEVEDVTDKSDVDTQASTKPVKPLPPLPPSKPPRTHVHDDYVRAKLEQAGGEGQRVIIEESDVSPSKTVVYMEGEDHTAPQQFKYPTMGRKSRPNRPPPPLRKPRPFSIATDTMDFRSNEESDSADETRSTAPSFYEVLPYDVGDEDDPIKHWDLPRMMHPEPIRRSLSDDCIHRAVDDQGNVIYMDVSKPGGLDNFDIYVDTAGYAVPNRLVRRDHDLLSKSVEVEDKDIGVDVEDGPSRPIGDRMKSKFKKFKNLFTDQEKPVGFDRHSSTVRKGKIDAIRRKVDQAFDSLHSSGKRPISETGEDDLHSDNLSNESDSLVDEQEIQKRVEYSRSVRFKTSKGIKESLDRIQTIYPQLFEHAMIVSLELNTEKNLYEPVIKYKFPEIRNYKLTMEGKLYPCSEGDGLDCDCSYCSQFGASAFKMDTNVSVPQFCFPDAANFKPSSSSSTKSQSYNFVLTNIDGGRVYGYCRRLLPQKSHKIPEVICIISPVDAFKMYTTLLEQLEKKRMVSMEAATELIAAAFGRPLPPPGKTETIRTLDLNGEMETIFLTRELDNHIENVECECLLSSLGTDKLLKVFASILMERSILFCAKHLSTLSATIHAITSLLYPLSWQHTFIPVLPAAMLDVVCSPTPYIMGITSALLSDALALPLEEHVLVVDLDKKSLVKSQGDEGTLLPKKIEKVLKTTLNMCKIDSDARQSPDIMISEAFLRFFIEAIGHYGLYIEMGAHGRNTFIIEEFVRDVGLKALEELLEWLVETQMFEVFKTNQLESTDWGDTMHLFQQRVQEHNCNPKNARRRQARK